MWIKLDKKSGPEVVLYKRLALRQHQVGGSLSEIYSQTSGPYSSGDSVIYTNVWPWRNYLVLW